MFLEKFYGLGQKNTIVKPKRQNINFLLSGEVDLDWEAGKLKKLNC